LFSHNLVALSLQVTRVMTEIEVDYRSS
jgi:hypothetical protein